MSIKNKVFIPMVLFIFLSMSIAILAAGKPVLSETGKQIDMGKQKIDKIGFADFLAIYNSYSKTKAENERLDAKSNELKAKIEVEKAKITELEKKLNSGVISEEERGKLSKEIEDIKTQANKEIQEFKTGSDTDRRQTIEKLVEELREKVSNYGKEKGYTAIFDKNQLIFSDTNLDLTKEIVDYINKE